MPNTFPAGTHVRIFDEDGTLIGYGVYMGVGPIAIDVPNHPVAFYPHSPSFEMDVGYTLYGDFHVELASKVSIH